MELSNLGQAGFLVKNKQAKLVIKSKGGLEVETNSAPIIISGPGEYEVNGFSVIGFKNGAYLIEAEDIRLGVRTEKEEVDVLLTSSWEAAKNSQPNIVIPIDEGSIDELAKSSGLEKKPEKKLVLNKVGLPEETVLITLEPKG